MLKFIPDHEEDRDGNLRPGWLIYDPDHDHSDPQEDYLDFLMIIEWSSLKKHWVVSAWPWSQREAVRGIPVGESSTGFFDLTGFGSAEAAPHFLFGVWETYYPGTLSLEEVERASREIKEWIDGQGPEHSHQYR